MSVVRAASLASIPWLFHGFGTRHDGYWTPAEYTAKLHQVHGREVVAVAEPGHFGDGDALMTASPNLWLEIRTADCVPVLLADQRLRRIAAVHAGWRGTAAGISAAAVQRMAQEWGSRPEDLLAAIGPHISACCFEVGEEVAGHFPGHITRRNPRPHVDLGAVNRVQLVDAGIPDGQIESIPMCTFCNGEHFYSFRRDKGDGRMVSSIAIGNVS